MKRQICKYCAFYYAYFSEGDDGYGKLTHGYCSKHRKPLTQFENCEHFKNNEKKEEEQLKRLLNSLETALTSVNEIAQILKEKKNDKEESG